jgi:hypothetical protein
MYKLHPNQIRNQQVYRDKKRANGLCLECWEKAEPFARCFKHRLAKAKAQAKFRERRANRADLGLPEY